MNTGGIYVGSELVVLLALLMVDGAYQPSDGPYPRLSTTTNKEKRKNFRAVDTVTQKK